MFPVLDPMLPLILSFLSFLFTDWRFKYISYMSFCHFKHGLNTQDAWQRRETEALRKRAWGPRPTPIVYWWSDLEKVTVSLSVISMRIILTPILWKDPDAGKDWRQKKKWAAEDEMVRQHHRLNGHEFDKLQEMVEDRGTWCAAVHGVAKSQIRPSNLTTLGLVVGFVGVITCVKLLVSICWATLSSVS